MRYHVILMVDLVLVCQVHSHTSFRMIYNYIGEIYASNFHNYLVKGDSFEKFIPPLHLFPFFFGFYQRLFCIVWASLNFLLNCKTESP